MHKGTAQKNLPALKIEKVDRVRLSGIFIPAEVGGVQIR